MGANAVSPGGFVVGVACHQPVAFAGLLPSAYLHRNPAAWAASPWVLLASVRGLNLDDLNLMPYQHPGWVRLLEFGGLLVVGWIFYKQQKSVQCVWSE